jgi:AraC-like DNA-binding protein
MSDVLSDLLRAVRFRGALFYYVEGVSPWAAETPAACEILPAILPTAEHMIEFHGVVRGSCWGGIAGEPRVHLREGDVLMFPQGDSHVMSSGPLLRAPPADKSFFFSPRPPQLPFSISLEGKEVTTARLDGGGQERATIACGFLGLDARPFNPLLEALPRVLHVPGEALGPDSWVRAFFKSVVTESNRKRPGGEAVLERMSEMLFVEVLRRFLDTLPAEETGWLAGMRDPAVGHALALLHGKPAKPWTLEDLAAETGLSRSAFHERFVHLIGQPPMHYLTRWRMQLASGLLRDTDAKQIEIALDTGYDSEAAFSRAFKREVGVSPREWRRERRAKARAGMEAEGAGGADA